jgi:hypothetical protein
MADDTDTIIGMLDVLRGQLRRNDLAADKFNKLKAEYLRAKKNAKSAADWERYQTAFAGALPEFTKGVISADAAFKSGDVFGGAAAIMDICATAANFIGALSAAGGPPGAVIAAIFSVVSMILDVFKPQMPSLEAKIDDLLRMLKAEGQIEDLETAKSNWRVFSGALEKARPDEVPAILRMVNPVEGKCFDSIRHAYPWLQNQKNYSQDLWMEILITQCQVYVGMMLTCTLLTQRAMSAGVTGSGVPYRSDPAFVNLVKAIDVFTLVVNECHLRQLEFLNDIRPSAQDKGLVWHVGYVGTSRGKPGVAFNKYLPGGFHLQTVPRGVSRNGVLRRFDGLMDTVTVSAVRPGPTDDPLKPRLAAFYLEARRPWPLVEAGINLLDDGAHNYWSHVSWEPMKDWGGDIGKFEDRRNHPFDRQGRHRWGMSGNWELSENSSWKKVGVHDDGSRAHDIWAMPGKEAGKIHLCSALGDRIDHTEATVTNSGFDYNYGAAWNTMPAGYKVGRVRSIIDPSPPFRDEDPAVLKDILQVVYGLCEVSTGKSDIAVTNQWKNEDHMEVRAYYYTKNNQIDTKGQSFLAPWGNIRGIAVDSRYLWVFRVAEIACATHTSVKACLDNSQAAPSWNTYRIPDRTTINPKDGKIYDGLLDLAACDDGTLTAAVGIWCGPIYTMMPRIDRKAKSIEMDKWRPFDDVLKKIDGPSEVFRVHKTPVGGWSIIEGLMEALEKTSTTLKTIEESVRAGTNAVGKIRLPLPAAEDVTVTFTTTNKEAILAPDPIIIIKGDQESGDPESGDQESGDQESDIKKSGVVIIKTIPMAKEQVATITAVLSTSFTNFQPLELRTTLKTVPETFKLDGRSVIGGEKAKGVIALAIPAAEDVVVTFEIAGKDKEFFTKPSPITIKKGTPSQAVFIKTKITADNVNALITATAVHPSHPFVLHAKLTAVPPNSAEPSLKSKPPH